MVVRCFFSYSFNIRKNGWMEARSTWMKKNFQHVVHVHVFFAIRRLRRCWPFRTRIFGVSLSVCCLFSVATIIIVTFSFLMMPYYLSFPACCLFVCIYATLKCIVLSWRLLKYTLLFNCTESHTKKSVNKWKKRREKKSVNTILGIRAPCGTQYK